RINERNPEFLLEGPARDQLAVLGRIDLIARRAPDEPHLSRLWKPTRRGTNRQCRPGEGEHRIGHCYIDTAALPALVARTQGKQNVDHRGKTASGNIGREHGWYTGAARRTGRQFQYAGFAYIFDVVPGLVHAGAALAITGNRTIDEPRVERARLFIPEAKPRHYARPKLLEENIGTLDE